MLPIRKLGATYLNMWTGSRIQKPEVFSKMPEIVRNVVKFTAIRKMRHRKVADKPEVVVYFGLLLILTRQNFVTVRDRHSDVSEVE